MPPESPFEKAGSGPRPSFLAELGVFLRRERKWWLVPIAVTLLLLAVLAALSSTGAAPFIYTLF